MANELNEETNNYLRRRKSDSNLLRNDKAVQNRKQMAQQINKSIAITMAERQLSRQNPQEDTFHRALEIKFHHSVGSMSISPACRDVVLAG